MWSLDRQSLFIDRDRSRWTRIRLPNIVWLLAALIIISHVFILALWIRQIRSPSKETLDAIVANLGDPTLKASDVVEINQQHEGEQHDIMADICIAMASNIQLPDLVVFVTSFRKHSPENARLVLFLNAGASDKHVAMLNENRVEIISIDLEKMLPESARGFHPSNYRWLMIRDYLRKYKLHPNTRVLLIDARDSAFQRNPFEIIPDGQRGVWASLEPGGSIANCGWNRGWVRDCFGDDILREIGMKKISCSGVTIGTGDEILQYLDLMADTIESHASCERNGIDQGVHNVLVWTNKIPGLHIIKIDDGQIVHVQSIKPEYAQVVDGLLLTAERDPDHPYAIVHQYDRSAEIVSLYRKLYPA